MTEEIVKTASVLLTVLLPSIAALFAFRASERRAVVPTPTPVPVPQVIDYTTSMKRLSSAVELLSRQHEKSLKQDADWRNNMLREVVELRRATQRMAEALSR